MDSLSVLSEVGRGVTSMILGAHHSEVIRRWSPEDLEAAASDAKPRNPLLALN